jgi:HlyD family secretion protein
MNLYKALDEQGALAKWDIQKSIEVKNISFSYPSTSLETLQNISINIQAGSLVGIVGSSGSGKSTLIDIILGLIQPKSGEIIVDGITVNASNLRKWQNSIGVVSQNIFLTDSSIKENVAFGVPCDDIQEERVEEALRLANIDSFISSLPEGFNTRVGERGVQLSGGQRQRIGIARALYNKANILVFDEATSSLDGITEKKVMDAVHTLAATKTIIIVAHRLASVRKCDVIYLLNEGKQIDSGTYDTLSSENAMFKKMTELS